MRVLTLKNVSRNMREDLHRTPVPRIGRQTRQQGPPARSRDTLKLTRECCGCIMSFGARNSPGKAGQCDRKRDSLSGTLTRTREKP
jgi:hypothetical protein